VPQAYDDLPSFDIEASGLIRRSGDADDGRHLIIAAPEGDHRLWVRTRPGMAMAVVLPIDDAFDLRLGAALRLFRSLRGDPPGALPARLHVTPFQRARLALLLAIFDRLLAGGTKREIARDIIYPRYDAASAAEWKGSAERRRTQRLCDEAKAMVAAGYRRLLVGK
jgi:hypothetical protein